MTAASIIAALWPLARKAVIQIGRWVLARVRCAGAQTIAARMERRARGYQTRRLEAAKRRGDKLAARFRTGQIKRWLAFAALLRQWATRINAAVADGLSRLAIADRIPVSFPGEGRV
jgi:hypothetical protein